MEPPDMEAGHADSWSRPVALPDRATLTVGYETGHGRPNYGERMIARGPRHLVLAELQSISYTIASERSRARHRPDGRACAPRRHAILAVDMVLPRTLLRRRDRDCPCDTPGLSRIRLGSRHSTGRPRFGILVTERSRWCRVAWTPAAS